jgi:CMP-N-acetylneuraminic acid synthetase
MKIVAIVPIKAKSKRVKNKNFKLINGKPLYSYILNTLKKCKFDEIYVDSDSLEIKKFCIKNRIRFIERKPKLALDNANGNDLLNYHAKVIEADLYFQIFVTAPLLKQETINKCIKILSNTRRYDSILTSKSIYSWFWFNNRPINYDPKILPRSQDAKPVTLETTGLYGIKRKSLLKRKARIGINPYFFEVSNFESIDLDTDEDFEMLKFFLKKNGRSR